jgi:hypothetical protein
MVSQHSPAGVPCGGGIAGPRRNTKEVRSRDRGTYSSVNSPPYSSQKNQRPCDKGLGLAVDFLPPEPSTGTSCQHFAGRSSLYPSPSPCYQESPVSIIVPLQQESTRKEICTKAQTKSPGQQQTDQNNLNSQSYTRLKSPAMVMRSPGGIEDCPSISFWGERLPESCARLERGQMGW